ncbi:MAG: FAD-binding oxidoreductase [Dehalococcoidia bacterium]
MTYELEGQAPGSVIKPASITELSEALAEMHAGGKAAVPWGGGTRMHVGNLPERYDAALDLARLNSGIEHVPGDMTLIVDAGVRFAEVQAGLAKAGQRLPFDVPDPGNATIGGSVASNAAGPLRSSFGGIRDWVIGMKIVLPDGTVTKTGGRVVKNVQGYDMHRLHTGAFGTLGVIAEVAFKLTPLPKSTRTVAAWFSSLETAADMAMQVFNGPLTPEALSVFTGERSKSVITKLAPDGEAGEAQHLLLALVTGGDAGVARQVNELTGTAGAASAAGYAVLEGADAESAWQDAGYGARAEPDANDVSARVTVKPTSAFALAGELERAAPESGSKLSTSIHVGFGTVIADWSGPDSAAARLVVDTCFGTAKAHGGSAVIERCPYVIKRDIDVFGDPGPSLAIMRSIKEQFDPGRNLNPGRFVGGI